MDEDAIRDEYGACVWILEQDDKPYLVYHSLDTMLDCTNHIRWHLIDLDVCEGTWEHHKYYASPWPVHSLTRC